MNIDSNNYKKFTLFILVLVGISTLIMYGISAYFEKQGIKIPWWIETPSIPSIYALLFLAFDKILWKLSFFKKWGIIVADDLNGEWRGNSSLRFERLGYDRRMKKRNMSASPMQIGGKWRFFYDEGTLFKTSRIHSSG